MSTYTRKTPAKTDCGIEKTLQVIAGKWKPAILSGLIRGPLRLTDIQKGLPEASKRALTQQLGEMVEDGLILKEDFNEYPRRTEYTISELGRQLQPVFDAMTTFASRL